MEYITQLLIALVYKTGTKLMLRQSSTTLVKYVNYLIQGGQSHGQHDWVHIYPESVKSLITFVILKVSKGAKIRNRHNQVPHLTQDTNGKVTHSQLDTTNESQEVSAFQAGDHKAHINRRAQRHSKHKTEKNP